MMTTLEQIKVSSFFLFLFTLPTLVTTDCVPLATIPGLSGQYMADKPLKECRLKDGSAGVLAESAHTENTLDKLGSKADITVLSPIDIRNEDEHYERPISWIVQHYLSKQNRHIRQRLKREEAVKTAEQSLSRLDQLEQQIQKQGLVPEAGSAEEMFAQNGDDSEAVGDEDRTALRNTLTQCNCHNYTESAARVAGIDPGRLRPSREAVCAADRPRQQRHTRPHKVADCKKEPKPMCRSHAKYRTYTGECNNLKNLYWGRAGNGLRRITPNTYNDGLFSPRIISQSGWPLPSARVITDVVMEHNDVANTKANTLNTVYGQFLSHDISHTPMYKMKNLPGENKATGKSSAIQCCPKNGLTFPVPPLHPQCFPIEISKKDFFYKKYNQRCMQFVRSVAKSDPECVSRPMQQMNSISPFIDGSTVYTSRFNMAMDLRTLKGGLLKDNLGLLPSRPQKQDPTPDAGQFQSIGSWTEGYPQGCEKNHNCEQKFKSSDRSPLNMSCGAGCVGCTCYAAGDKRVNEQPQLTLMHTIWVREHNRIARVLAKKHAYDESQLFEEVRRIVVAEFQHIAYSEYLPMIVGYDFSNKHGLLPLIGDKFSEFYNDNLQPDVANEFSTAAFRMGHSQIQGIIKLVSELGKNRDTQITDQYFFPNILASEKNILAEMVRGMIGQPSLEIDYNFDASVLYNLFRNRDGRRPFGMDLAALNTQRGRDHGIGTYTQVVKAVLGKSLETWNDLFELMDKEDVRRLSKVYEKPADVDLYVGGLLERHVKGAMVGPTFQRIIGDTFFRLRFGDRFFYDNRDMYHNFTEAQLVQLRRTSMARVLCDNLNGFNAVPPLAMLLSLPDFNRDEQCSSKAIPSVDLSVF